MFNSPNTVAVETITIIKEFDDGMVAAQHKNGYVGIFDAELEDGFLVQMSNLIHPNKSGKTAVEIADEMMAA